MKTEDFDDAVRNKFESINQKYDEQEIDNVYSYVKQNLHLPFWRTYGVKMFYTAGVAAMSGLIIWNIVQHQENKILTQKIDSLRNNSVVVAPEVISAKPDTVFITKYVYQTLPKEKKTSNELTENSIKKAENIQNINSVNNEKQLTAQNYRQQNNSSSTNQSLNENLDDKTGNTRIDEPGLIASSSNIQPEIAPNNNSEIKNQEPKTDDQNIALNSNSTINNNSVTNEVIKPTQIATTGNTFRDSTETEKTTIKPKHIAHNNSLLADASKQIKNTISDAKISLQSDPTPSQISLKYLHYRFGLGLEKANRQMAANLLGEILFSKRFGLSTGVKFLGINNEKYNNENDFHTRKGMYFRNVYLNQIPDTNAENIGTRDFLIQIPVSLNYQLPIKNNFALLLGIGTDLDLHAKQFVNFDHHDNPTSVTTKNFETNIPVSVFNNLVISTGVQKRWGHYVLQVRPFISPQLKSVVYKKEDAYFGLKCNFLFTTED